MYRNSLRLICILPISVPISNPVNHSFVRRSFSIYRNTNMDIKPGVTRIGKSKGVEEKNKETKMLVISLLFIKTIPSEPYFHGFFSIVSCSWWCVYSSFSRMYRLDRYRCNG